MHVVLDFDGTITEHDTIGVLASFAISYQRRHRGSDLSSAWAHILEEYASDLGRHVTVYQPQEPVRIAPKQEIAFLRSLRHIELRSLARVQASGLFAGISTTELEQAGRKAVQGGEVRIRKGFSDFVREAARDGRRDISVVSVNWSASFVRGVLSTVGVELDVLANEVLGPEDGRILGPARREGKVMVTSEDKLDVVKTLLERERREGNESAGVVYFGDSATDLECLLEGKGVVVANGPDGKLLGTLRRLRVDVNHLSETPAGQATVAWARDFDEVRRWDLFGLGSG